MFDPKTGKHRKRGRFHIKGVSDILGIHKSGRLIAIEVKTPHGKASKEQEAFIGKINRMGGLAGVATSIQACDDLLQIL